jgi:CDP-paratose 2-epimerase
MTGLSLRSDDIDFEIGVRKAMSKLVPFRSVLIFGGAGFVGSNWAYRLLQSSDARVHLFDNLARPGARENLEWLRRAPGACERLKVTIGDVRNAGLVEGAVRVASEIYHFAAQVAVTSSLDDPRLDFEVNVGGTLNILEAARKCRTRPFLLFTSTNKVYGCLGSRPLAPLARRYSSSLEAEGVSESQPLDFYSPYGCSKGAADQYVHDYNRIFGLPTVVFRMSCIAGPHQFGNEDQGWVAHFLYSALLDKVVTIYGDGRQVRDVLYIDDLVRAFELVRDNLETTAGHVYNIGGGSENSVSLLEMIEEIQELTGKRQRYQRERARPGDQLCYVTNYNKLQQHTGWQPQVEVRRTLENMYMWWKQNREILPAVLPEVRVPAPRLQEIPGAIS